ncbi:MAG: GIN domain-containing protein [Bacteroidales bacterium]
MKQLLLTIACTLLFCSGVIAQTVTVTPEGKITSKDKQLSNFSKIEVNKGLQVIFKAKRKEKVIVEANENIHQYIEVLQSADKITVTFRDGVRLSDASNVKIYISAKQITEVSLSGGSNFTLIKTFSANDLKLNLTSGSIFKGNLQVANLEANLDFGALLDITGRVSSLQVNSANKSFFNGNLKTINLRSNLSQSSVVDLNGSANLFEINASGESRIEASNFVVNNVICNMSGRSSAKCTINHSLSGELNNGSSLSYKGNFIHTRQSLKMSEEEQLNKMQ